MKPFFYIKKVFLSITFYTLFTIRYKKNIRYYNDDLVKSQNLRANAFGFGAAKRRCVSLGNRLAV